MSETLTELLNETGRVDGSYVRGVVQALSLARFILSKDCAEDRDKITVLSIVAEEWRDQRKYHPAFLDALIDEAALRWRPYSEKLQDPRWQKKRLEILQRDGWRCLECDSTTTTLHVHHKSYEKYRDPWDYENENFRTLCKNCHAKEKRSA